MGLMHGYGNKWLVSFARKEDNWCELIKTVSLSSSQYEQLGAIGHF